MARALTRQNYREYPEFVALLTKYGLEEAHLACCNNKIHFTGSRIYIYLSDEHYRDSAFKVGLRDDMLLFCNRHNLVDKSFIFSVSEEGFRTDLLFEEDFERIYHNIVERKLEDANYDLRDLNLAVADLRAGSLNGDGFANALIGKNLLHAAATIARTHPDYFTDLTAGLTFDQISTLLTQTDRNGSTPVHIFVSSVGSHMHFTLKFQTQIDEAIANFIHFTRLLEPYKPFTVVNGRGQTPSALFQDYLKRETIGPEWNELIEMIATF